MEYITKKTVLKMLNKIENVVEDGDGFQFNEWVEYAKDIPSAEKTAEWKYNGCGFWVCTNCGYPLDDTYYAGKYCLNCGCKMKEVEE